MKKLLLLTLLVSVFALGCTQQTATTEAPNPQPEAQAEVTEPTAATDAAVTEAPATEAAQNGAAAEITADEAKQIALDKAGVQEADIHDYETEQDQENGRPVYEIQFDVGETEYEYYIDRETGEILKEEIDR